MATRDLDRLAQRVYTHRLALYKSRLEAARAAGISKDTWKKVEEGQFVQDGKLAEIDSALGWSVGSCIAIAEGGEPVLVEGKAGASAAAPATPLDADVVRKAVFEAARRKMPAAPIGELDGFADEIVDVLRRAGEVVDEE
jgi:hypothetical protein